MRSTAGTAPVGYVFSAPSERSGVEPRDRYGDDDADPEQHRLELRLDSDQLDRAVRIRVLDDLAAD
jgi:hypothetical protein